MKIIFFLKIVVHFSVSGTMEILVSDNSIFIESEQKLTNIYMQKYFEIKDSSVVLYIIDKDRYDGVGKHSFPKDYVNGSWVSDEEVSFLQVDDNANYLGVNAEIWSKQRTSQIFSDTPYVHETIQTRSLALGEGSRGYITDRVLHMLPIYQPEKRAANIPPFLLHDYSTSPAGVRKESWKVEEIQRVEISSSEVEAMRQKFIGSTR